MSLYLVTADGVHARTPMALCTTRDIAETARHRLHISSDGWHRITINPMQPDIWHHPEDFPDSLQHASTADALRLLGPQLFYAAWDTDHGKFGLPDHRVVAPTPTESFTS